MNKNLVYLALNESIGIISNQIESLNIQIKEKATFDKSINAVPNQIVGNLLKSITWQRAVLNDLSQACCFSEED